MIRIKSKKRFFFITLAFIGLVCTLIAHTSQAQITKTARLIIDDNTDSVSLTPYLYITEDPDNMLNNKIIASRHENNIRGERHDRSVINLGVSPKPVWMVLSVTNDSSLENWVLHFGKTLDGRYGMLKRLLVQNQSTNDIITQAFREKGKPGAFGEDLMGAALPIKIRPGQTDLFVFYIQAEGSLPATYSPKLMSFKAYNKALRYGDFSSIIAGIFFISMMGVFVAVSYIRRKPAYLFFILYYFLLSCLFFLISNEVFAHFSLAGELFGLLFTATVAAGLPLSKYFLEMIFLA